jgi:hypothetical protein
MKTAEKKFVLFLLFLIFVVSASQPMTYDGAGEGAGA